MAYLCLFWGLMLAAVPVWAQDGSSSEKNRIIQFFQDHLSGADGNRCPMTPSCSAYAARAIEKHGLIIGSIMALDRILRCGHNEVDLVPRRWIGGRPFSHDPVSANDFWWYPPRQKEDTP